MPYIQHRMQEENFKKFRITWKIVNVFYTFLMFTCLVVGSYYIYSNYGKLNNSGDYRSDLCHEGLYKFAFGITTACYVLATLLICCVCCCGLCQYHDQRSATTQQRHRLNNETSQSNPQQVNSPTLNTISNRLQNGHRPVSENDSSLEGSITPNHTDRGIVPSNSHLSDYTQETVV